MINHNIQSMNLDQYDEGEIYLPSEAKSNSFESTLRQFIILTRRAFNEPALDEIVLAEGMHVTKYNSHVDTEPYFGITLKATTHFGKIEDFAEEHGETFFDSILRIASTSVKRGVSGKRAIFVREFRRDPSFPNTVETQIVISTSVFYNDYRVTTGFPSTSHEIEEEAHNILARIAQEWGHQVQLEVEAHKAPYEESPN